MESKPTVEELLRQQLEILAERSANEAGTSDLPQLTHAMLEVHRELKHHKANSNGTGNCDSEA